MFPCLEETPANTQMTLPLLMSVEFEDHQKTS